jgi:hypothetical protein
MEISRALAGMPIEPEKRLVDGHWNPRHAMSGIQGHYDIGDGKRSPFKLLTDTQAARIERELFSLGIRYLRHWLQFQIARDTEERSEQAKAKSEAR